MIIQLSDFTKKLTRKELFKMWCNSIYNSNFHDEFLTKQKERLQQEYIICDMNMWLDLVGIHKNFNEYSNSDILKIYGMASWIASHALDFISHKCEHCNTYNFYIENQELEYYNRLSWLKEKCHTLYTDKPVRYGSVLDCDEKVELKLCDGCLSKIKDKTIEYGFLTKEINR